MQEKKKWELVIDEEHCQGCGYCIKFCKPGCIEASGSKLTSLGLPIAVFAKPESCTGCKVCIMMCPVFSIELYRGKEEVS